MAASVGLAMNPPHTTDERAVFTQLKPVRMSGADGAEDSSVFEDVKPAVRVPADPVRMAGLSGCFTNFCFFFNFMCRQTDRQTGGLHVLLQS